MSLPPLPKKIILHTQLPDHFWYGDVVGHTDAAIQAYGQQCYEQSLLDAMNATTPFGKTGAVIAAAIGALK
jgi:hypothetical protein